MKPSKRQKFVNFLQNIINSKRHRIHTIEYIDEIEDELKSCAIENGYDKKQLNFDLLNHPDFKEEIKDMIKSRIYKYYSDIEEILNNKYEICTLLISEKSNKKYYKNLIYKTIDDIYKEYLTDQNLCIACENELEEDTICDEQECLADKRICCDCSNIRTCKECDSFVHKECLENKGECEECEEIYCSDCNPILYNNHTNIHIHAYHDEYERCESCNKIYLLDNIDEIKQCNFCKKYYCDDCEADLSRYCEICLEYSCDKCAVFIEHFEYDRWSSKIEFYCGEECCPDEILEEIEEEKQNENGFYKCSECKEYFKYETLYDYEDILYCDDCIPEEILLEFNEMEEREKELKETLGKYKLKLREDSKLCENYIEDGEGDINEIVQRMCEMKYLFEYCNMRKRIKDIKLQNKDSIFTPFQEAEYNILKEKGGYPKEWPWMISKLNKDSKNTMKLPKYIKPIVRHNVKIPFDIIAYIYELSEDKIHILKAIPELSSIPIKCETCDYPSKYILINKYNDACHICKFNYNEIESYYCEPCLKKYDLYSNKVKKLKIMQKHTKTDCDKWECHYCGRTIFMDEIKDIYKIRD